MKDPQLIADQFKNDPNLLKAKKALMEAIHEHQHIEVSVRPPQSQLKESYAHGLEQFYSIR